MTHFWPKRANDLDIIKNPRQLTLEPAVSDLFTMGSGQRVQGLRKRGSCRPRRDNLSQAAPFGTMRGITQLRRPQVEPS